jgi:hypothetical protein
MYAKARIYEWFAVSCLVGDRPSHTEKSVHKEAEESTA